MGLILLIIVLVVLFVGGGGYYANRSYGPSALGGWVGIVLIVLLVLYLTGNL